MNALSTYEICHVQTYMYMYVFKWSNYQKFVKLFYKLIAPLAVIFPAPSVSTSCVVLMPMLPGSILVLDGGFLIGFLLFPAIIKLPGTFT